MAERHESDSPDVPLDVYQTGDVEATLEDSVERGLAGRPKGSCSGVVQPWRFTDACVASRISDAERAAVTPTRIDEKAQRIEIEGD